MFGALMFGAGYFAQAGMEVIESNALLIEITGSAVDTIAFAGSAVSLIQIAGSAVDVITFTGSEES